MQTDINYSDFQTIEQKITRNFWLYRFVDIILFIGSAILIPYNLLLGLSLFSTTILFSYYTSKGHEKNMEYMNNFNPCHAVWVGDSYFFNTMTVQDGYFNISKIYSDDRGLYLYRSDNLISALNQGGNKEYLKPHVQEAYLNYKQNQGECHECTKQR